MLVLISFEIITCTEKEKSDYEKFYYEERRGDNKY
jgi:hypothetical protein